MSRLSVRTANGRLRYSIAHRPRITRHLHLELDEQGELRVVVPKRWSERYVQKLMMHNAGWAERFLQRARARQLAPLEYTEGARHLYLGKSYPLAIRPAKGGVPSVQFRPRQIRVETDAQDEDTIRSLLRKAYREQAEVLFERRLRALLRKAWWAGERPVTLRLRRMKRTWGTCNRQRVIRLNTHLIKAPVACLDYIISHELCHLRHMHHGPTFQALQDAFYPRWQVQSELLRTDGERFTQE